MSKRELNTKKVCGQLLTSSAPGYWRHSDGTLFMRLASARLGVSGARYSLPRWSFVGTDRSFSTLETAVRYYCTATTVVQGERP
jgi:hypothetical protein